LSVKDLGTKRAPGPYLRGGNTANCVPNDIQNVLLSQNNFLYFRGCKFKKYLYNVDITSKELKRIRKKLKC
tara:strand:+ start:1080 stop:1292 length:213 start_codon:yes stop_codon:yes gene_type:complete